MRGCRSYVDLAAFLNRFCSCLSYLAEIIDELVEPSLLLFHTRRPVYATEFDKMIVPRKFVR